MNPDNKSKLFPSESKYSKSNSVNALRGHIYQLKLMMMFVIIGCKHALRFRLATELVDADKFDDLVFQCENDQRDGIMHRFLQAKHRYDESKTISAFDLMSDNDDDFSLQKYFKSYRRIKRNPAFKGELKDFIICTNINLDFNSLDKAKIEYKVISTEDIFLPAKNLQEKTAVRIRLAVNVNHELINKLKETSQIYKLRSALSKLIEQGSKYKFNSNSIIRDYKKVLEDEKIFVFKSKRFSDKISWNGRFSKVFLENSSALSKKAQELRKALQGVIEKFNIENSNNEFTFNTSVNSNPNLNLSLLPDDHVTDEEISDFLSKLVLAVNQPNEIELSEIISREMTEDSKFNSLTAELATDSFQRQMIDWFKELGKDKGKEGNWITNENAEKVLKSLEENFNTLISHGASLVYFEELEGFEIKFRDRFTELKRFLTNSQQKKVFNVLAAESTFLSAIKVQQEIEFLSEFKDRSSFIFIRASSLASEKSMKNFIKIFKSQENRNLLVFECDSFVSKDSNLLLQELTTVLEKSTKKIVLISKSDDPFMSSLKINTGDKNFEEVNDKSCFTDLDETSQQKLLLKKVTFQGEPTTLSQIFGNSKGLSSAIDAVTFVKLIKDKEIVIGKHLRDLGESEDFFVSRKFNHNVELKKHQIFSDIKSNRLQDLFVISDVDLEDDENTNIFVFNKNEEKEIEEKFRELSSEKENVNVHWLKGSDDCLVWVKSHGSMKNLAKYRRFDNKSKEVKEDEKEDDLLNNVGHVIISGTAGIGKSIMMTDLSNKLKLKSPNVWVLRLDLNDFTSILDEEKQLRDARDKTKEKARSIIDFFIKDFLNSQEKTKLETNFEKELFKSMLINDGKIALFLDGFDEISPDYDDLVIELLKALKDLKLKKLFVSTRPSLRQRLEENLEVFCHTLIPFSAPNQKYFLTMFWSKKFECDKELLEKHAEAVIAKFSLSISDREKEFIGIPLQIRMVAEIFEDFQQTSDKLDSQLPEQIDLLTLFEKFVKKKFYDNYFKQGFKIVTTYQKKLAYDVFKQFEVRHKLLSLAALFQINDLLQLLSSEEMIILEESMKDIVDSNEGVVDEIIEHRPNFVHRTFAEYFVSFAFIERVSLRPEAVCTLIDCFISNSSPVFVNSLTKLLNDKKVRIDNQTFLSYVTEDSKKYSHIVNMFLDVDYVDDFGKTSLHYAVSQDSKETVDFLLNCKNDILDDVILKHGSFKKKEYESSDLVKFVNFSDNEGKPALAYASKTNHSISCKLLLKGASIEGLDDEQVKLVAHYTADLAIGAYAYQDFELRPIQEILFLRNQDYFAQKSRDYYFQSRILSYFFLHGRTEVIDALLKSIEDVSERKNILNACDNGESPLDRVTNSSFVSDEERLKVISYILDNGGGTFNINSHSREIDYFKILYTSASKGHLKTFKFFLHQHPKNYHDYFYMVARAQQFEVMDYLLDNYAEGVKGYQKNTSLHLAASYGASVKVLNYLIKRGENVNARNENGETPILQAVNEKRQTYIIKFLATHGADINIEDDFGKTPLMVALETNQADTLKCLLSEGAKASSMMSLIYPSIVDYFNNSHCYEIDAIIVSSGLPRLHHAFKSRQLNKKWIQFLIRNGADHSKKDLFGFTPIEYAVACESSLLFELLLQRGSPIDLIKCTRINKTCNTNINGYKISWLLNVFTALFQSENLLNEMKKHFLRKEAQLSSENCEEAPCPYWYHFPDVYDTQFPALHILNVRNAQGTSLIHLAADMNDIEALNEVLSLNDGYILRKSEPVKEYEDYQNISMDTKDSKGNTPLHIAADKGHTKIVEKLLERGATFNHKNLEGKSPQDLARNKSHNDIVKTLRAYKNMFSSVYQGKDLDKLKSFVKKGLNLKVRDRNNKTLLHYAIESDQMDVVALLLRKLSTDLSEHFDSRQNANNKCEELMIVIRKLFDDVQSESPQRIIRTLKKAPKQFGVNIFDIIDIQNEMGNSLLHYAAESNDYVTAKWLMEKGAVCDRRNKAWKSPAQLGFNSELKLFINTVSSLLELKGSILDAKEDYGMKILTACRNNQEMTLLHLNAEVGNLKTVKWLVNNGADVKAEDSNEKTPCDLAREKDHKDVVEFLENLFL